MSISWCEAELSKHGEALHECFKLALFPSRNVGLCECFSLKALVFESGF